MQPLAPNASLIGIFVFNSLVLFFILDGALRLFLNRSLVDVCINFIALSAAFLVVVFLGIGVFDGDAGAGLSWAYATIIKS